MIPDHDRQLTRGCDSRYSGSDEFWDYFESCDLDELVFNFLKNGDNYFSALEIVDPSDKLGYPDNIEETTPKQFEALVCAVKCTPDLMNKLEEQEYNRWEANDGYVGDEDFDR